MALFGCASDEQYLDELKASRINIPDSFIFVRCSESEFNYLLNYIPFAHFNSKMPHALLDDLGFPIAFYLEDLDTPEHKLYFYKRSFENVRKEN